MLLNLDDTHVAVAGDWDSNASWIKRAIAAVGRAHPQIRTILHLGDFKLYPHRESEELRAQIDTWCAEAGIERLLITPGNHEHWDWLDAEFAASPGQPLQLTERITALPRGYRFTVNGRSFLSFGGAYSINYDLLTPGRNWFWTELPTNEAVDEAISGGPVDVLLTHETVNGGTPAVEAILDATLKGTGSYSWGECAIAYSRVSRERVTRLWDAVSPKVLLHGHMHVADEIDLPNERRVISLGCDERPGNVGILDTATLSWSWLRGIEKSARPRRILNVEQEYLERPES